MTARPCLARGRPFAVALVQEGLSVPSGHACMSATFYLTAGLPLARHHGRWPERVLLIGTSMALALLVGVSRVMLGVH